MAKKMQEGDIIAVLGGLLEEKGLIRRGQPFGPNQDWRTLGLDSLELEEAVLFIEDHFSIDLGDDRDTMRTAGDMAREIRARLDA